ncbi:MAG: helix-turn-helix transcriptional regulator [Verrucomicrobiota bacterium]
MPALQNGHHTQGSSVNNPRLKHIQNWPELAREAKWSASALAERCGVSVRTLHRYFLRHMGKNTKTWLDEQRQHDALELLRDGSTVKETATYLGYKEPNSFSRHYKSQTGTCPSQQAHGNRI